MKKTFFILVSIIFFISNCNIAFGEVSGKEVQDCLDLGYEAEVIFHTSYGELKYNFDHSQDDITVLASNQGILEQGLFASGLSTISVSWEVSIDSITRIIHDDEICVIPNKIHMFLGYVDPIIYISNELEQDSCEYNVVLRHEETHQQINKTALDHFIPKLNSAIRIIAKDIEPIRVYNLAEISNASTILSEEYISYIAPLVNVFKDTLLEEQKKLDSNENYSYESKLCTRE